jgi:quercetin dioxygenase-like cupin family protein
MTDLNTADPTRSHPQYRAWDAIASTPVEAFDGKVSFKALTGEVSQVLRVQMAAGVRFPNPEDPSEQDVHPSEQIDVILSGRIKFVVDGREWVLGPGEALSVPPNVPHTCEVLEDVDYYEVFVPPLEEELITGSEDRTS